MKKYTISGMSCAACQSRVEKAVNALPNVDSAVVSLLTNSMQVEGSASDSEIIQAVEKAGYGAKTSGGSKKDTASMEEDQLKDTQTPILRKRLIVSLVLLIPLMYISMGHMMWDWPLPAFLIGNHIAMGLIQMLFTIANLVINQKFFISGFKGVLNKAPNMDTLVAMGAGAAFAYSTYVLFAMTDAQVAGNMDKVMEYMHDFYFESAAMIVTLITLGKMLESYSKGKTTDALKSLMKMVPKTATIIEKDLTGNEKEKIVSIEDININDVFVVKPGENIPVDGIVIDGFGAVDESAITGESIPVDKTIGSKVSSAGVNQSGYLKCKATRVGEDTTLAQIIQMVSDASATKAPIAKVADKVSGIFVPVVICIALVTIFAWLIAGETVGFALARGISVLVISCPCALVLSVPLAFFSGIGAGSKKGILFKGGIAIEGLKNVKAIVMDKTGTITKGNFVVQKANPAGNAMTANDLLAISASCELSSTHPIGNSIVDAAKEKGLSIERPSKVEEIAGHGIRAELSKGVVLCGNRKLMDEQNVDLSSYQKEDFGTEVLVALNGKFVGNIVISDTVKEDAKEAIAAVKKQGIITAMLTGDAQESADAVAKETGIDEVHAKLLPQDKLSELKKIRESHGAVMFVGDGINDAPVLAGADVGAAMGSGADAAIEAADVVFMNSEMKAIPEAVSIAKMTNSISWQNVVFALAIKIIVMIMGLFGFANMWIAVFADTGVSVLCLLNSIRILHRK